MFELTSSGVNPYFGSLLIISSAEVFSFDFDMSESLTTPTNSSITNKSEISVFERSLRGLTLYVSSSFRYSAFVLAKYSFFRSFSYTTAHFSTW